MPADAPLRHRSLRRFATPVAWMGFIFLMSALPNLSVPEVPGSGWTPPERPAKKVAHFVEYAVLGLLWSRALGRPTPRSLVTAVAITALYGASDEVHQIWVPTRHARVFDACVDAFGGAWGAAVWWVVRRSGGRGQATTDDATR
jgi:VanZ family protein